MNIKLYALFICLWFSYSAFATDAEKEQRIAEQTIDTLFLGEPVWLKTDESDDNSQFLGLFNAEQQSKVSLLLLHGSGQGPNTNYVISPLREAFSDMGYTTFSIQLPVINDASDYKLYLAEYPLAVTRINTAINYLETHSDKPIVIVGHSMGGNMLMHWLKQADQSAVSAIVAIGMSATFKSDDGFVVNSPANIPIFDIYGQDDTPVVLENAPLREAAISASHPNSKQLKVEGADHFFGEMEQTLATIIEEWLTDSLAFSSVETNQ